jgi:2-keto-4-pentenoate hydratase
MRGWMMLAAVTVLGACAAPVPQVASCPSDAQVEQLLTSYTAREPAANPDPAMSLNGGQCGRDKFVGRLMASGGEVIGYKAGLTNPAVQKRFNYPHPVRGTLLKAMILEDGAVVPADFGSRPLFEADLVVEVADSGIHEARTPMQVLAHLRSIRPFIELPDLVVKDPGSLTGAGLVAINVGARLGVLGAPVPARADPALSDALREMTVRLTDGEGRTLDTGRGGAILEHPLNAVIWLAADLREAGVTLKAGDLLSLGSFSKLFPPKSGLAVTATYEGLPGNPSVSVRFR